MTIISNVKSTLANARGIQESFSYFAQTTADEGAKKIFHECMMDTEAIVQDLQLRVEYMKAEELQYRKT